VDANLAYKRGTGAFGSLAAPEETFGEGTSRFALISADINLNVPFKVGEQTLRYNGLWRMQSNRTPLTPQDRFAIGGRYTVRGFDGENTLSSDRGWFGRNDLGVPLGESGQELYAGLDYGQVGGRSSAALLGTHLAGAVLGLRGRFKSLHYDVFVGTPVSKPEGFKTAGTVAGFTLNINF
jgi:hemolysin activation/secretion protein